MGRQIKAILDHFQIQTVVIPKGVTDGGRHLPWEDIKDRLMMMMTFIYFPVIYV